MKKELSVYVNTKGKSLYYKCKILTLSKHPNRSSFCKIINKKDLFTGNRRDTWKSLINSLYALHTLAKTFQYGGKRFDLLKRVTKRTQSRMFNRNPLRKRFYKTRHNTIEGTYGDVEKRWTSYEPYKHTLHLNDVLSTIYTKSRGLLDQAKNLKSLEKQLMRGQGPTSFDSLVHINNISKLHEGIEKTKKWALGLINDKSEDSKFNDEGKSIMKALRDQCRNLS